MSARSSGAAGRVVFAFDQSTTPHAVPCRVVETSHGAVYPFQIRAHDNDRPPPLSFVKECVAILFRKIDTTPFYKRGTLWIPPWTTATVCFGLSCPLSLRRCLYLGLSLVRFQEQWRRPAGLRILRLSPKVGKTFVPPRSLDVLCENALR